MAKAAMRWHTHLVFNGRDGETRQRLFSQDLVNFQRHAEQTLHLFSCDSARQAGGTPVRIPCKSSDKKRVRGLPGKKSLDSRGKIRALFTYRSSPY